MQNIQINQIVKGKVCGTFVVLGFRTDLDDSEVYAQLKPVNPDNHQEHGVGEMALPVSAIEAIA